MLALADAVMKAEPTAEVWALGTAEGLEARLVPARSYRLLLIDKVPFPRRVNWAFFSFPRRFAAATRQVQGYLRENQIEVVVGFGGYASAPAYLAARREGIPIVVHEANALPGLANRFGARSAAAVGVAFRNTRLKGAEFVGMPLRSEIVAIAKSKNVSEARNHFGLHPKTSTLLVTGGSLGARAINETVEASRKYFSAAGVQVLHIVGENSDLPSEANADFIRLTYCDRMDLAIAAADFAIARAGASTVSEFAAVGLPAVYVPYPVGNGEQKFNVVDLLAVGGALTVRDADFTPDYVSNVVIPVISDSRRLLKMSKAAREAGVSDGAERLRKMVMSVLPAR
jgi:UDP-N-acetylglucosamine--N-acetylmuramyl-(pentapeptide) pyrophosphoryl-undecaprenol N-acetylglucosamine transferase